MSRYFDVPLSIAVFAALDDDVTMLAEEYGIPVHTHGPRNCFRYPAEAKTEVLTRIVEVAKALALGSDCEREAKRALAWVRKQKNNG